MTGVREILQSPLRQGAAERLPWPLDVAAWDGAGAPANVAVTLHDLTDGNRDVSAEKLTGAPVAVGSIITLPLIAGLVAGHRYYLQVNWQSGEGAFSAYAYILGER